MGRATLIISLFGAGICAAPAVAADLTAYPSFTFRSVTAPASGATGRINVQIDPDTQFDALMAPATGVVASVEPEDDTTNPPPDAPSAPPAGAVFAWFWEEISPYLSSASPTRIETAVAHLATQPDETPTPSADHLQGIATEFGKEILLATIGTKVSPALVLAVMGIESAGKSDAVSSAGAEGLMQLIPATAERFGVTDSKDPADNIRGGVAYLDWLMKEFGSDPVFVLAAYNAGENAVRKHGGVPEYAETRAYVPKVLSAWTVARELCVTPPQLMSDGCVFHRKEARNDG